MAPFPWSALPRVDRRSSRLVAALHGWLTARSLADRRPQPDRPSYRIDRDAAGGIAVSRGGTHLGGARVGAIAVLAGEALQQRLADPTAAVARIRAGRGWAYAVGAGAVVRAIAQQLLGGPDELGAPRPLTPAERAVWVVAVAAELDELAVAAEVELCELGGPQVPGELGGEAAIVDVEIDAPVAATLALAMPVGAVLAPPRMPLAELAAARPGWLDLAIDAPVVVGDARLDRSSLGALRPRDVLVVDRAGEPGRGAIRLGRGQVGVALAPGDGTMITVVTLYQRGQQMDEILAEDATVDVAVALGDVRMSLRSLLELRPGQVLELRKPLGSAVELRIGARVVARGELVDVEGELGVRVSALDGVGEPLA